MGSGGSVLALVIAVMLTTRVRFALSQDSHAVERDELRRYTHDDKKETNRGSEGRENEGSGESDRGNKGLRRNNDLMMSKDEDTDNVKNEDEGHEGINGSEHAARYHIATFDFAYVATPFIVSLWVVFASAAKIVFHLGHRLSSIFPESCLLIIIGIILGLVLFCAGQDSYQLDASTFFLLLMPPIILDAGYFLPVRYFFDNIGTILLFAVVGTLLNTLWLGVTLWMLGAVGAFEFSVPLTLLHALVFASLLAAVDPVAVLAVFEEMKVNEVLYIIVLGESLLNDGISVVLYRMFTGFSLIRAENVMMTDVMLGMMSFLVILFGSTVIGVLYGLIGSLLSRFTRHVRVIEPIIVFVIGYLSFLSAEMFHLSGIISCMFCAITMKKYIEANISQKSHTTIKYFMKMLSSICESIIFMYLGISVVCDNHLWNPVFIFMSLFFCLLYRALGVVILSAIVNRFRSVRLSFLDQLIMSYGGLRGAVAFALVVLINDKEFHQKKTFVTTTIVIIYFTNLMMGSTVKPLVNCLKVKKSDKHKPSMNEKITLRCIDHLMAGIEDITDQHGHHLLRERFLHINNKYLKPVLIRKTNAQSKGWSILNVCQKLDEKDIRELLHHSSSFISQPDNVGFIASSSLARLFSSASLMTTTHHSSWNGSSDNCLRLPQQQQQKQALTTCELSSLLESTETGASMTCLDLQAQEVQNTRKMRDDSKIHHIIEDSVFKPRKKFLHHRHHIPTPSLPISLNENNSSHVDQPITPHHHNAPVHLRHLLSHSLRHPGSQMIRPSGSNLLEEHSDHQVLISSNVAQISNSKSNKNVSFAEVTNINIDKNDLDQNSLEAEKGDDVESEKSEDEGIIFTVSISRNPSEEDFEEEETTPVAVELSLPWKRNSGREPLSSVMTHSYPEDGAPVRGEAPTWVDSSEFLNNCIDHMTNNEEEEEMQGMEEESRKAKKKKEEKNDFLYMEAEVSNCSSFQFPWKSENDDEDDVAVENKVEDVSQCLLPLPWKTNDSLAFVGKMKNERKDDNVNLDLESGRLKRHLVKSNSVPTRHVNDCQMIINVVDDDLSPLPWRIHTTERVIQDQHAPRPPHKVNDSSRGLSLPWKHDNDIVGSPSASYDVESYSIHPQMSCHSFRLSEAESRHSEPLHLQHHVIEITQSKSNEISDYDLEFLDVEVEMDINDRVNNWLNSTKTPQLSDEDDEDLIGQLNATIDDDIGVGRVEPL